MKIHIFVLKLWMQYCLCFFSLKGFTYCSNITTHRNPWRNCLASCEDMLQYLSSQQKSHQSDNSQSYSYSDAKCYLCTHGKPSGEYWGARTPQAFGAVAVKGGFSMPCLLWTVRPPSSLYVLVLALSIYCTNFRQDVLLICR